MMYKRSQEGDEENGSFEFPDQTVRWSEKIGNSKLHNRFDNKTIALGNATCVICETDWDLWKK